MILVDTSAWIEYLRGTGHTVHRRLAALIDRGTPIAITEPVLMEVLAGARDEGHAKQLRGLLTTAELLPVDGLGDYERAADIYRACRGKGGTIRSLIDCLIASVAIRNQIPVLHRDADFDVIARHTALAVEVS